MPNDARAEGHLPGHTSAGSTHLVPLDNCPALAGGGLVALLALLLLLGFIISNLRQALFPQRSFVC